MVTRSLALQNRELVEFLISWGRMLDRETLWERVAGCLHGLLIGDVIGSAVEGWTSSQIQTEFGRLDQMVEIPGHRWRPRGLHSDDGQHALATLDAICNDAEHPELRFAEILVELRDAAPQRSGRFGLHRWVGRGMRQTIRGMQATGIQDAFAHATPGAGCQAAGRIAPAALWWRGDPAKLTDRVVTLSAVTHSDIRAITGALALAHAIEQSLVASPGPVLTNRFSEMVVRAEQRATEQLGRKPDVRFSSLVTALVDQRRYAYRLEEVLSGIATRARAVGGADHDVEASSEFAASSVLTALAIVDLTKDFETAIVTAVNLGGKADTIGAMVGALAGARLGFGAIPSRWLDNLRATGTLIERIEKIVALEPGECHPDLLTLERQWDAAFEDRPHAKS